MSKLGEKEAAMRAMREARHNKAPGTAQRLPASKSQERRLAQTQPAALRKAEGATPDDAMFEETAKRIPVPPTSKTGKKVTLSSVEAVQAATDEVIDKFAAGKVKLTIRIDRELMKEIKIDAVEGEQTVEAWVEAAIRQELKARRA